MEAAELGAIESAVEALGRHDPVLARSALAGTMAVSGPMGALLDTVGLAATQLETEGEVSPGTWDALADVMPAELAGLVEAWRT